MQARALQPHPRMTFRLILALGLAAGCAGPTNGPSVNPRSATALPTDSRYATDSSGHVLFGPTRVDQVVVGQRDRAGNIHVAPMR